MPKPRQFVQMLPGDVVGNGSTSGRWDTALSAAPAGFCYYITDQLDLRALMAGKESGIDMSALILQEAGPWALIASPAEGYFMVIDFVTTQRPTELFIGQVWEQPVLPGHFPGFLLPDQATIADKSPSDQDFNPSQVAWGLWRIFGVNTLQRMGTIQPVNVNQSGYFGTGETLVSPGLFWTRIIIPFQDGDNITIPSANLVSQGVAVDLSMPQEMSQMMRAVQR